MRLRIFGVVLGALAGAAVLAAAGLVTRTAASMPANPAADNSNPVPFDHTVHAGEYEMPCLSCHVYANQSPMAGLPSARKCMGCHKFVGKDKPAVQALAALFEQGQVPHWQRVTRVPDFIYFSHRAHVRRGVDCAECHGDVKQMKVVTPAKQLTMGFCLDCHKKNDATSECVACHK